MSSIAAAGHKPAAAFLFEGVRICALVVPCLSVGAIWLSLNWSGK